MCNLYLLQWMCIIREYVYSLIFSGNMYIPWFSQGIYIFPKKVREYTYSLKYMTKFYTHSLNCNTSCDSFHSNQTGSYRLVEDFLWSLLADDLFDENSMHLVTVFNYWMQLLLERSHSFFCHWFTTPRTLSRSEDQDPLIFYLLIAWN